MYGNTDLCEHFLLLAFVTYILYTLMYVFTYTEKYLATKSYPSMVMAFQAPYWSRQGEHRQGYNFVAKKYHDFLRKITPFAHHKLTRLFSVIGLSLIGLVVGFNQSCPCFQSKHKMALYIPHSVLAAGWIPFVVVTLLVLVFSFIYIRYYQHKYDKEICSTMASVIGLAVALFTCALVPVDIFLVSYMKNSDGTFKDWALDNGTRKDIENGVLYTYYAFYLCIVLFLFLILPMSYFYYEEGDEDTTTRTRLCSAFKYSIVFILLALVLFFIGVFVPFKGAPVHNQTKNEWEDIKNIFEDLGDNHGENAVSFMISLLSLIGMVAVVVYTGIGMAAWPIHLIKGRRNVIREFREVAERRFETQSSIEIIRNRYGEGRNVSSRDRRRLDQLEDERELMSRRERHLEAAESSCSRKCLLVLRPFQIVFGVLFVLIALLIFISLLLSNIDKIIPGHSLGPKMGYALPKHHLPNLVDIILVFSQKIFPMDYILMVGVILFLVFSSMGGINAIGVWFCWIKMFKIRARKTKPQGLLFLAYLLMYIVLALNIVVLQIAPQYSTYGSQHYRKNVTNSDNSTSVKLVPCSTEASSNDCIMTRMATLIYRFFYKMWFFGAAYYWLSWIFLGVFVLSFLVTLVRKRRSYIEGEVDRDDLTDSDDNMIVT